MLLRRALLLGLLTLTGAPAGAQDVVFSRRVYAREGTTYQQIWVWSAADGSLKQLSKTPRDHSEPVCSPDEKEVFFWSATNALDAIGSSSWSFNRATGAEQPKAGHAALLASLARPPGTRLSTECDPNTASASNDGSRVACSADQDLLIFDDATATLTGRIPFTERNSRGERYSSALEEARWSPDGRSLLVGTYGEGASSTSHQLDYFLVDVGEKTWARVMTGNNAVWLPDGQSIVYETPRDLAPLDQPGGPQVWVAQLARLDVRTRKETLLTSGVSNNVQPQVCSQGTLRK